MIRYGILLRLLKILEVVLQQRSGTCEIKTLARVIPQPARSGKYLSDIPAHL